MNGQRQVHFKTLRRSPFNTRFKAIRVATHRYQLYRGSKPPGSS
jgi:hypothetical protein